MDRLVSVEAEILRGEWLDHDAGKVPLIEYINEWVKQRELKPRTREEYERHVRLQCHGGSGEAGDGGDGQRRPASPVSTAGCLSVLRAAFHAGATSTGIWKKALALAGVPDGADLHLHDLRHAGSIWSAQSGATPKELVARIGHSSTRAAMIYQHATRDRDRAIAAALDSLIAEARSKVAERSGTALARGV